MRMLCQQGNECITRHSVLLAVHAFEGEIKHGDNINSNYDDPHDSAGRFPLGLPRTANAK